MSGPASDDRGVVGLAVDRSPGALEYEPHAVRALMERAVASSGHAAPAGRPLLSGIITGGSKVLVKPNWVLHRNMSGKGMNCMVTHRAFLLEALRLVLECSPSQVIVGDAPVQGCRWEALADRDLSEAIGALDGGGRIRLVDFRRTSLSSSGLRTRLESDRRPLDMFVLFDLAADSLLEEVSVPPGRFRVAGYDHQKLSKTHSTGMHRYLLCREAFEADVVLSLPKLKTHRKAGITGALKNLVGLNGNKEYLPHHRVGGSAGGGDCYPGRSSLKRAAEWAMDRSNAVTGTWRSTAWELAAVILLRLHSPLAPPDLDGGWSGNDTVWRTLLDIDRIALYGRGDGLMCDSRQRDVWSLTDAIVCGQGNGPLAPSPCGVGAVTFSRSPLSADKVHAALLGLDWRRIPCLSRAGSEKRWPVGGSGEPVVFMDGGKLEPGNILESLSVEAELPDGWSGIRTVRS